VPDVDLRIRIRADGSAELVKTRDDLKEVGEQASKTQEQLDKFAEALLKGAGLGAGFSIGEKVADGLMEAGAAFVEATERAFEFSHQIELLAEKTGIGTTAWQEFDAAAKMSGTTIDSVASLITKMDATLEKGSGGFQQLGLDIAALKAESPEQAFRETAEALAGVGDAMERVAIAKEIFGKAGADAIPFIESMAEGERIAHQFGLVLSEEDVKATADLTAAGKELSIVWDGLVRQFVAGAAGGGDAKKAIDDMAPAIQAGGELFRYYGEQIAFAAQSGKALVEWATSAGSMDGGILKYIKDSDFQNYNTKGNGRFASAPAEKLPESIDAVPIDPAQQKAADARIQARKDEQAAEEKWETWHEGFIARDYAADVKWVERHNEQWKKFLANPQGMDTDQVSMVWDSLVKNGEKAKAKLVEEGDVVEVGNGLWERRRVAVGEALDAEHEATKKATEALQDHLDAVEAEIAAFDRLGQSLDAIGSTIGGKLGGIIGGGGGLSKAIGGAGGITGLGSLFTDEAGGIFNNGADEEGNGGSMMVQAFNIVGALGKALPIAGAALGIAKSIASLFGGKSEAEKIADDFGGAITDELAKKIADTESKDHVSRALAEMLNAADIFEQTGDTSKIFDLMNAEKLGAVNAKEGIDELGKAFTDLKTAADSGSVASEAAMVKMIQRARELGESIPAIDAAMKGFADDAQKNLADFIGGQGKSISGSQAGADSQIVSDVFALESSQNGVVAAAEAMQSSIDELTSKLPAGSSLTGGAAEAAYYGELAKNKDYAGANKTAVAAARIDKDLVDSGYASQATTDAFGTTATNSYNQAYAAAGGPGGGDQARIAAEQAVLPLLTQLQKDAALGIKISPDAKALLAQAQKDGTLPALDVATQSLGYLKIIAANTGGKGVPAGTYSAVGGDGTGGGGYGGSGNGPVTADQMQVMLDNHARMSANYTVSAQRANGM
jgi:hypothetical protein